MREGGKQREQKKRQRKKNTYRVGRQRKRIRKAERSGLLLYAKSVSISKTNTQDNSNGKK